MLTLSVHRIAAYSILLAEIIIIFKVVALYNILQRSASLVMYLYILAAAYSLRTAGSRCPWPSQCRGIRCRMTISSYRKPESGACASALSCASRSCGISPEIIIRRTQAFQSSNDERESAIAKKNQIAYS